MTTHEATTRTRMTRNPILERTSRPSFEIVLNSGPSGPFLYLIHFDHKRFHAGHYLGSSVQIIDRLTDHANGHGACLTRALWEAAEHWQLAALFIPTDSRDSIRDLERRAKRRKSAADYCPLCRDNWTSPIGTVSFPVPPISSQGLRKKQQ